MFDDQLLTREIKEVWSKIRNNPAVKFLEGLIDLPGLHQNLASSKDRV